MAVKRYQLVDEALGGGGGGGGRMKTPCQVLAERGRHGGWRQAVLVEWRCQVLEMRCSYEA